jgi:hypothetical protein
MVPPPAPLAALMAATKAAWPVQGTLMPAGVADETAGAATIKPASATANFANVADLTSYPLQSPDRLASDDMPGTTTPIASRVARHLPLPERRVHARRGLPLYWSRGSLTNGIFISQRPSLPFHRSSRF